MPKIPLYGKDGGPTTRLAAGRLGARISADALIAPARQAIALGETIGRVGRGFAEGEMRIAQGALEFEKRKAEIDYRFKLAEKEQQVNDKDAEISERIARDVKAIENDPIYTTASDARTAVDLYRTDLFNEIDGLDMTPDQKRALRLSATKSISIQGLNAEQKAYSRGLVDSGQKMAVLFDSKLDLLNSLDPDDPRADMIREDLAGYRDEAVRNGFIGYLPDAYQTGQGTEDAIAKRQTLNVITKDDVTEAELDEQEARLESAFRNGDISSSVLRSETRALQVQKNALKVVEEASQTEAFTGFKNLANNIVYDDGVTFGQLDVALEEAQNMEGRFAGLAPEDRPAIVAIISAGMQQKVAIEGAEVSRNLEFAALEVASTGAITAQHRNDLARLQELDPSKAQAAERALTAATTTNKFIGGLELASNAAWVERIEEIERRRDAAVEAGQQDDALMLNDVLQQAQKQNFDRVEALKADPKLYYDRESARRPGPRTGAGYMAWARSVGLRDDEITVFTSEQQEQLRERIAEASPVGLRGIYEAAKAENPGVGGHIIVQSLRKAGMNVTENILMVLADNPVSTDLKLALTVDDKQLKAEIDDKDVMAKIAQAVTNEMADFNKSIVGTQDEGAYASRVGAGPEGNLGGRATFASETHSAALKLAQFYVARKGMSPSEAARAAARIHTSQFVYSEINGQPIRVPYKYGQANADAFAEGLRGVLGSLDISQVQLQSGLDQTTQKINTNLYLSRVKTKGSWISTGDSTGVYLVDELGVPVKNRDGKRIILRFENMSGADSGPAVIVGEDPRTGAPIKSFLPDFPTEFEG